jgi:hypothetical protein
MCSPARCARCGKITWTGCGMHVNAVMANVQPAQRCDCPDRRVVQASGSVPSRAW